jgi:hypothetical protein
MSLIIFIIMIMMTSINSLETLKDTTVGVTLEKTSRAPDTITEEVRARGKALTLLNVTKWLSSFQQQQNFKVDLDQCNQNKKGI